MNSKLNKKDVVKTWALGGIEDFYIGSYISEKFPWRAAFFYHQGLEKLCKAYFLGTKALEYECKPEKEAKKRLTRLL